MTDVNKMTTEELLNSIGDTKDTVVPDPINKTLHDFIHDYNIIEGIVRVPAYRIYYEYKRIWRIQGFKLSKIEFFRQFNRHFTQKKSNSTRFYMLKKGIFSLDKESNEKAKKYDSIYRKKYTGKSKVKKEVSSVK